MLTLDPEMLERFLKMSGGLVIQKIWKSRFCGNPLDISNAALAKPAPVDPFILFGL
jgi:hypothetical protein